MKMGSEAPKLALPLQKSTPVEDLSGYSILLYGEPKVGKTSLAAEFPENMFLMFEPGARALSVYQVEMAEGPEGWAQFRKYLDLLEKDKRFKTVTVDTLDIAAKCCLHWVCEEEGFDHPADEGYGKGWDKVNSEFNTQIRRLLKMPGKGVIFTSHAAEKDIKTKIGEEYTKIVPTMANSARASAEALVDIWAYMSHEKEGRMIQVRGDGHVSAGHRLQGDHFAGLTKIPAGKTSAEAYKNFTDAFYNRLGRPSTKPVMKLGKK